MSRTQIQLASLLLREHFGGIVEKVGAQLMRNCRLPLAAIVKRTSLDREQVKSALCVLLQHNMASYQEKAGGIKLYKIDVESVLFILRYPRYVLTASTLYEEIGAFLIEQLLLAGQMPMSAVIAAVCTKENLDKSNPIDGAVADEEEFVAKVKDIFESLVKTHFIHRCSKTVVESADTNAPLGPSKRGAGSGPAVRVIDDSDLYAIPNVSVDYLNTRRKRNLDQERGQPSKRRKLFDGTDAPPDDGIYWKVNFDRFHQYFRDQEIVAAVMLRYDGEMVGDNTEASAGLLMQTILRALEVISDPWSPVTNPVSKFQIQAMIPNLECKGKSNSAAVKIKKEGSESKAVTFQNLEMYLSLLCDEPDRFLGRYADSQGGMYYVFMKDVITELASATIEKIVQERFGPMSLRIFRLLRRKKYVDQNQIEANAMLVPKEAKLMTYCMLEQNFVQIQEIPRTADYQADKTIYLFYVDLPEVARMVLELSYKSTFNVITRAEHEERDHKRVIEKQLKIDTILVSMQNQNLSPAQIQEVKDMITPPEQEQLDTVKRVTRKLEKGALQIDETIFILQTYLRYLTEK